MGKNKNGFTYIDQYPNVLFKWGTIRKSNIKSCFFLISTFMKFENDSKKEMKFQYKGLRKIIEDKIKEGYFNRRFIVNERVPDNIEDSSSAHLESEFHLFIDDYIDREDLINELNKLAEVIYQHAFKGNKKCYKTLKDMKEIHEN